MAKLGGEAIVSKALGRAAKSPLSTSGAVKGASIDKELLSNSKPISIHQLCCGLESPISEANN